MILGLLVGYSIDKLSFHSDFLLSKLQWTLLGSWKNLLTLSASLLIGGLAIYYGMVIIGLDPEFSIALATEYCQKKSWVHPDTTPFYSLMRSTGVLLGMGVASVVAQKKLVYLEKQWSISGIGPKRCFGLLFSLLTVTLIHSKYMLSFAGSGDVVFYVIALIKAAGIPFVITSLSTYVIVC